MLNIWFGDNESVHTIYDPATYFDNRNMTKFIMDPLSVEMIKDVDQSDVIGEYLIQSPVLGPIPPKMLSGGVKTLMLMAFDDSGKIFNASACGDNCAKWILRIAERKDLTVTLYHIMHFDGEFKIRVMNTGKVVNNMHELLYEAIGLV